MSLTISPVHAVTLPDAGISAIAPAKTGDFASALAGAVQNVQQQSTAADDSVLKLLSGENEEIHNVALAAQRAELAFELGLQVRNKIVAAYQEVMRMQL